MLKLFVANVTEAGDIVVLAIVLGVTLAVGGGLLALDAVVGRVHAKRKARAPASCGRDRADRPGEP